MIFIYEFERTSFLALNQLLVIIVDFLYWRYPITFLVNSEFIFFQKLHYGFYYMSPLSKTKKMPWCYFYSHSRISLLSNSPSKTRRGKVSAPPLSGTHESPLRSPHSTNGEGRSLIDYCLNYLCSNFPQCSRLTNDLPAGAFKCGQ